jgi:hypothetical protein
VPPERVEVVAADASAREIARRLQEQLARG